MSASRLTFRSRPVLAALTAVLFGLVLSIPAEARPGGGGGGGGGRGGGGGGGGFSAGGGGGGGGGFSGGGRGGGGYSSHGGSSFSKNFSRPSGGDRGTVSSRPRPSQPIVKPPGNRPDRPDRPNRPERPDRPNRPDKPPHPNHDLPWIPGAGIWWGSQIDNDDDWDTDFYYGLPNDCERMLIAGKNYYQCEGAWYQRVYAGNQTTYVAIADPR